MHSLIDSGLFPIRDYLFKTPLFSSETLTRDTIQARGAVQLVDEREDLAEGLIGPLREAHAAGGRLASQQALLPRIICRLLGEFL